MSAARQLRAQHTRSGVILVVPLTPKSARDEIIGVEAIGGETVLKAPVRAVPEAGRANAALIKFIADWLKLPPPSVAVARDGKSRIKHIAIEGDASALARLIEARLSMLTG